MEQEQNPQAARPHLAFSFAVIITILTIFLPFSMIYR